MQDTRVLGKPCLHDFKNHVYIGFMHRSIVMIYIYIVCQHFHPQTNPNASSNLMNSSTWAKCGSACMSENKPNCFAEHRLGIHILPIKKNMCLITLLPNCIYLPLIMTQQLWSQEAKGQEKVRRNGNRWTSPPSWSSTTC